MSKDGIKLVLAVFKVVILSFAIVGMIAFMILALKTF